MELDDHRHPARRSQPPPPGTVLRVARLWEDADPTVDAKIYFVGPYSQSGGLSLLWLFAATGELWSTADRGWVDAHFEVVALSSSRDWYMFPQPWPPATPPGAAA